MPIQGDIRHKLNQFATFRSPHADRKDGKDPSVRFRRNDDNRKPFMTPLPGQSGKMDSSTFKFNGLSE